MDVRMEVGMFAANQSQGGHLNTEDCYLPGIAVHASSLTLMASAVCTGIDLFYQDQSTRSSLADESNLTCHGTTGADCQLECTI